VVHFTLELDYHISLTWCLAHNDKFYSGSRRQTHSRQALAHSEELLRYARQHCARETLKRLMMDDEFKDEGKEEFRRRDISQDELVNRI
jgi:hypothetical protein